MRVLIVDDNASMRRMVSGVILAIGAHTECAESVDGALSAFAVGNHDLVITDIEMGGKTGFDLIREIRSTANSTVVFALTSRTDLPSVAFFDAGFDWVLWKPLDVEALVTALRAVELVDPDAS